MCAGVGGVFSVGVSCVRVTRRCKWKRPSFLHVEYAERRSGEKSTVFYSYLASFVNVEYVEGRVAIHIIAEELDSTGQPYPPSTTTTACSLKTTTPTPTLTLTTTAMQMLPLMAATSFEHRGPQCLLTLGRSTSPPLDQFPVRVCSYPLCIINRL